MIANRRYTDHERAVARKWWDDIGRGLIGRHINVDDTEPRVQSGGNAPAVRTQRTIAERLPSGILEGKPFDQLTSEEQNRVIEAFQDAYEPEKYPERETPERRAKKRRLKIAHVPHRPKIAEPWKK